MGFLLQKLVSRLLFPVPLVVLMQCAALVALLVRRRRASIALSVSALLFLGLLSNAPVSDALLWNLEQRHLPLDASLTAQQPTGLSDRAVAIVVLGSGHSERPELSGLHALSTAATARVAEAVRLSAALPDLPLWFTGGVVEGNLVISEVAALAAVQLGVTPHRITTDSRSRNTRQEAALVMARLVTVAADAPDSHGAEPPAVILVTSASHMPRAVALFDAAGVRVIPAPTDYRALGPPYALWSFLPSVGALHNSERAWYEYLGRAWARIQRSPSGTVQLNQTQPRAITHQRDDR